MRFLIFGSGTIGYKLSKYCKVKKIQNILFSRKKNKEVKRYNYFLRLEKQIKFKKDDIGILSFGISDQGKANKNKKKTFLINYKYTKKIIDTFIKKDQYFVFFSSAAVFGSNNLRLYNEKSKPSPQTYYGNLKARLEKYIVENSKKYLIVRTGWVSSLENNCIIKKLFYQLQSNKCNIYPKARTNLIILDDFIKLLFNLIKKKINGIHHISKGFISRKKIADLIIDKTKFNRYNYINADDEKFNYQSIINSQNRYNKNILENYIKRKINYLINQNL